MFGPLGSLAPELVWGLFTRALGLVLLISFASLARQIVPACGSRGPVPIGIRLNKIAQDFPTWRRFYYFPTLLWISHNALEQGLQVPSHASNRCGLKQVCTVLEPTMQACRCLPELKHYIEPRRAGVNLQGGYAQTWQLWHLLRCIVEHKQDLK